VPFDPELRDLTEATALQFGRLLAEGRTPPAVYKAERCRSCSLIDLCRPKATVRSALNFRSRLIEAALNDAEGDGSP